MSRTMTRGDQTSNEAGHVDGRRASAETREQELRRLQVVPRSVGAAAEAVLDERGRRPRLQGVFEASPVPMLLVDRARRYVEVNRPARLTLAEMRRLRIDELTPPEMYPVLETAWARLHEAGCVAGPYVVADRAGGSFDVATTP